MLWGRYLCNVVHGGISVVRQTRINVKQTLFVMRAAAFLWHLLAGSWSPINRVNNGKRSKRQEGNVGMNLPGRSHWRWSWSLGGSPLLEDARTWWPRTCSAGRSLRRKSEDGCWDPPPGPSPWWCRSREAYRLVLPQTPGCGKPHSSTGVGVNVD